MKTARAYVEAERLRVAAMEANLQSNIAIFQGWVYEVAMAEPLEDLDCLIEVLEAHSVMEDDAREKEEFNQQVWLKTREMVNELETKVSKEKLALKKVEDLLTVLESNTESHVNALHEMMNGAGITSNLICVCIDPTCFFPIQAW